MELPLFPLKLVFFPGQVQPLHIFEPRYREMINHCIESQSPFGIVLIDEGEEEGDPTMVPHEVGTAARIVGVKRHGDGRVDITAVGTKRFRIRELNHTKNYLSAEVQLYPVINGSTQRATDLMQKVRPRVIEYVDLLSSASKAQLPINKLPLDPTSLAFLIAMSMPFDKEEKQKLLSLPGVPDILSHENYLLWREISILEHMINTQDEVDSLTGGPTGYVFPN